MGEAPTCEIDNDDTSEEELKRLLENTPGWGGERYSSKSNTNVILKNTCPIDNLLYILYINIKTNENCKVLLGDSSPLRDLLVRIIELVEKRDWFLARTKWIETFCVKKTKAEQIENTLYIDFFSSEFELFVFYLSTIHATEQTTRCNAQDCPRKYKRVENPHILFRYDI